MEPISTAHDHRGLSSALADSLTKNKRWLTRCERDNSRDQEKAAQRVITEFISQTVSTLL